MSLTLVASVAPTHAAWPRPAAIDEPRLRSAGLRVLRGEHATVVTDLPAGEAIDTLPDVLDAAVPLWADRFAVSARGWRVRAYVVGDEARFRSLGLWPTERPDFPHGIALGHELWIREQPTDYYRRHLLLHEATHSFMMTRLGSCGPGWHMEAVAELCGTHAWDPAARSLRIGVMPASRDEAPEWGRVRMVRDAVAAGRLLSIAAVQKIDNRVVLPAESYAWVWALAHFLDRHPRYGERFRALADDVTRPDFNERFDRAFAADRPLLDAEWRLFVSTLVYGHDLAREAIEPADVTELSLDEATSIAVAADRGWQMTPVAVRAGQEYSLRAEGRFTIGREPTGERWPCEASGVTLAWHGGQPVGRLIAAVLTGGRLSDPQPIGLAGRFRPTMPGVLCLRVNDAPNALADNAGELRVTVRVAP